MPTTTQPDMAARMSHVRAGLLNKARATAQTHADMLGVTLTDEQADEAARRILKAEQAARVAQARVQRVAKAREDFASWAVGQGLRYGDTLNACEPTIPLNVAKRLTLMAVRDELDAPDGHSRPRLIKRLDAFVARAREAMQATSVRLDSKLVETPVWSPTLDEVAEEQGLPSWSGLTDADIGL